MRRTLVGTTTVIAILFAFVTNASAATFRLPSTGSLRTSSSSVKSSSADSSAKSASSMSTMNQKAKNDSLIEYCAAIAATLAKGEKVTSKDGATQQHIDQTFDLLKKAHAICGVMNFDGTTSTSSSASSVCAPDGFMGVKGSCNGKSWSTGGVCKSKSYWEAQVKQSCTSTMMNVSYEQPCSTKGVTCSGGTSSTASSVSSSCATDGFKGAKILCSGKPISSGGVCKSKSYWEAWAKQTCATGYTGFDVQVPCAISCTK